MPDNTEPQPLADLAPKGGQPLSAFIISRDEIGISQALGSLGYAIRLNIRNGGWQLRRDDGDWQSFDRYEISAARQIIRREFSFADGDRGRFATFGRDEFKNLLEALLAGLRVDPFIADYLSILINTWDGKPRIDYWGINHLGVEDTPLNRAICRTIIINLVRRAYFPGCKVDYLPILVGEQGCGKSSALKALVPEGYFSDSLDFGLKENRQRLESIGNAALVELPELNGLCAQTAHSVKAFITQTSFDHRDAYEQSTASHPPRFIIVGTANNAGTGIVPHDATGQRRYPILFCNPPRHSQPAIVRGITADREQMLAEALEYINPNSAMYDPAAGQIPDELMDELELRAYESSDYDQPLVDAIAELPFANPVILKDILDQLKFDTDTPAAVRKNGDYVKPYLLQAGWVPPGKIERFNGISGRYWRPPGLV